VTAAGIPDLVVDPVPREGMKLACALMRDPAPLHWDDEEVRRLGLGDRAINPGVISAAWVARMLGGWTGDYANVQRLRLRFLGRVHAEDRVTASGAVEPADRGAGADAPLRVSVELRREGSAGAETVIAGEAFVRIPPPAG
jgi:acyl dehydratase